MKSLLPKKNRSKFLKAEALVAEKCVLYNWALAVWRKPIEKCELANQPIPKV